MLKHIILIANQLMLNELETAYWQLVNKATEIEKVELHNFLERLMMTALYAKRYTTSP